MPPQNHTAGCLTWHNGTAKILETRYRRKGTGALQSDPHREPTPAPTPEPMPALPATPPAPTGNTSRAQHSQIINLPAGYVRGSPVAASMVTSD